MSLLVRLAEWVAGWFRCGPRWFLCQQEAFVRYSHALWHMDEDAARAQFTRDVDACGASPKACR